MEFVGDVTSFCRFFQCYNSVYSLSFTINTITGYVCNFRNENEISSSEIILSVNFVFFSLFYYCSLNIYSFFYYLQAIKLSEEPKRREWPFFNLMDVYFSDQVNDPTLRLFSSTKTLGADSLDESITLKFEDDPVMSAAISAATGHSLMDISDMMRAGRGDSGGVGVGEDRESDKASERDYEDMHPEVQMNNSNYNGGDRRPSPPHPAHALNKSMNSSNAVSAANGPRVGTPIGMQPQNDYDDSDDIKPPMAHTPVYMPQHHNIDQVRTIRIILSNPLKNQ